MNFPRWPAAALSFVATTLIAGCSALFITNIYDIQLRSVEIVDWDAQAELRPEVYSGPRPSYLARVRFTTTRDLVAFAPRTYYMAVVFDASPCRGDQYEKPMKLSLPHVYNTSGAVDYANPRPAADAPNPSGRYEYYAFIPLTGAGNGANHGIVRPAYDLRQDPLDLCFVIAGGSMLGVSFTSNTVRIPAEALRQAMARANLPSQPQQPPVPQR